MDMIVYCIIIILQYIKYTQIESILYTFNN